MCLSWTGKSGCLWWVVVKVSVSVVAVTGGKSGSVCVGW